MTEQSIWKQFNFVRNGTIKELDALSEATADVIPAGFNNNIRWNLGHILTTDELLFSRCTGIENQLPENYIELFARGTKPEDWKGELPSIATLQDAFKQQLSRLQEQFGDQLSQPLKNNLKLRDTIEFTTVGELLNFSMYHEGLHIGFIRGLKKAL